MNPIQPGAGSFPESRRTPPLDKEKVTQKGEAPKPAQPEVQEPPPQMPAQRAEPVQVKPTAQPEAVAQAPAEEALSLSPEQAEAEVTKLVDSNPQTAGDLSNLAEQLEDKTSRS